MTHNGTHACMDVKKCIISSNVKGTGMVIKIHRLEGYLKLNGAESRPRLEKKPMR